MRGLASEKKICGSENGDTHKESEEIDDKILEHIKNEAIKTWNMGRNLGIKNISSEEEIIKSLMEAEETETVARDVGKKHGKKVY